MTLLFRTCMWYFVLTEVVLWEPMALHTMGFSIWHSCAVFPIWLSLLPWTRLNSGILCILPSLRKTSFPSQSVIHADEGYLLNGKNHLWKLKSGNRVR